jgi:hypothetical protein
MKANEDGWAYLMIEKSDWLLMHKFTLPAGSIIVFDMGCINDEKYSKWHREGLILVVRLASATR